MTTSDESSVITRKKPVHGFALTRLDGNGCKNDNVTDYRYALVESDTVDIEIQNAIIRELELPVACLVYSGGKSIHAIVKIEAGNYEEYRQTGFNYLYDILQ